ncbi:predicted protein [Naegleria gruberi]|uniref:Predicted protein n=1 Tax=Naegleria gruberi TaxID=5762 RepID=D2VZJ7_NAEGR|nr:uncharacterized protein NAEGRDRAFT_74512 [Naegleria gruberi]EFC37803.1 predicted protein [Naegleria gruberi]|eukprot:XP_002670547.1 predicted protein [Naegleria gruberi strain NEG-M]
MSMKEYIELIFLSSYQNPSLIVNGHASSTAPFSSSLHNVLLESLNSSTTITNTTNNGTSNFCDPSLFNTPWSREVNGSVIYGLCPDTYFSMAFCLAFVVLYLLVVILSGVGVYWKRKSGHIVARNPIYLYFTLGAALFFVISLTMRVIVGRKIYPCGLLTASFFTFPPAICLPTIFRMMRTFFMYKINLQKAKLFDSSTGTNKPEGKDFELFKGAVEPEIKHETPTPGIDFSQIFHAETSPSVHQNNPFVGSPSSTVDSLSSTTDDVDDVSNSNTGIDSESIADVSTWNFTELKEIQSLRSEIRKLKIYNFVTSLKFITIFYILGFIFGLVVWLIIGGIEEALYSFNTSPDKKRIFLYDGGLFVFDHGCGMTSNSIIIVGIEAILYIILEFICFIMCVRADKDTWGIKLESLTLIVIQILSAIIFLVAGNIEFIFNFTEYYFPYGFVLWGYMLIEIIVCVTLPVLYAIVRDNKDKVQQAAQLSTLEKILKNKKTFQVMLDFARRSYCTESILCWRDIQRYRLARKKSHRKKAIIHILGVYLTFGAPLELNMPNVEKLKQEILAQITGGKFIVTEGLIVDANEISKIMNGNALVQLHTNLFQAVQEHCLNDMSDLFERLKNSNKEIAEIVKSHKELSQTVN